MVFPFLRAIPEGHLLPTVFLAFLIFVVCGFKHVSVVYWYPSFVQQTLLYLFLPSVFVGDGYARCAAASLPNTRGGVVRRVGGAIV